MLDGLLGIEVDWRRWLRLKVAGSCQDGENEKQEPSETCCGAGPTFDVQGRRVSGVRVWHRMYLVRVNSWPDTTFHLGITLMGFRSVPELAQHFVNANQGLPEHPLTSSDFHIRV